MVIDILSWLVWGFALIFTIAQWQLKFGHADGGVRLIAGRNAMVLSVALLICLFPGVSKFHLIWAVPIFYFGTVWITGTLMGRRIDQGLARIQHGHESTGRPLVDIIKEETDLIRHGTLPESPSVPMVPAGGLSPSQAASELDSLRVELEKKKRELQLLEDPETIFAFGLMALDGDGVEKNSAEAAGWFRIAGEMGHVGAQHNLGTLYEAGDGVEFDACEAAK